MDGFPSMHEKDGTILIFVLKLIGSRGGARCWSLTLGWVVRDGPQSLVYITQGSGAILQSAAASASAINEEAARRLVGRGHEYRLTNCLMYICRCERAARHNFGRIYLSRTKRLNSKVP